MNPIPIWQEKLSPGEWLRGGALSVLYVALFPFLMAWVQRNAWEELPVAESNVVYYLISVLLGFVLFSGLWKRNLDRLFSCPGKNLKSIAAALVAWIALDFLVRQIPLPVRNPNESGYALEYLLSPGATGMIVVVLMPIVEELLFRGLLFGGVRRYSRGAAYLLSMGLFALYCVWQFVFSYGRMDMRYLLLAVQYLPAGVLLAWCYERGGSLWSAVLLHMAINGLTLLRIVAG